MGQTFATIVYAGTGTAGVQILETRTDTLRSCFSGDDPPTSPVTGQLWFETDTLTLHYYDGSGWVEVGTVISSNVDFNNNQLLQARMDNESGDPTPATGNVGLVVLHTGAGKLKVVASASTLETVISLSNADLWSIPIPLRSWSKDDTNPPTEVDVGTTPIWRCWLFDAVAERMHTSVSLPYGFSEDATVILRVHYLLNSTVAASKTCDAEMDYNALTRGSVDVATKDSTNVTVNESVGSNGGQYTYHKVDMTMAFNDSDNPLEKNDALAISFGLNSIANVPGILVFHTELLSPVGQKGITEIA